MRHFNLVVLTAVAVAWLSGCTTLHRSDEIRLRELRAVGISETEVQVKHPGVAAGLNLLPGFGNFYLGAGTNEGSQWAYGFLNLLFWPVSIVWAAPAAAIDAGTINKKETAFYYTYDPTGIRELAQREAALASAMAERETAAPPTTAPFDAYAPTDDTLTPEDSAATPDDILAPAANESAHETTADTAALLN
ncbi:hypothetical protein [Alcanivorax quisquiliarum]|uniref:Lipoprotein n=1 Tax=Alcanivorax quisquiliarum TaxID=2933565 RepID=A0ABT0E6Z6_9GAMM|nr:hypothetical protein [Alcanivorax quisquiliarum]MCK0537605.1 hypothetical protein [Alcanivorax quisquiliarum]